MTAAQLQAQGWPRRRYWITPISDQFRPLGYHTANTKAQAETILRELGTGRNEARHILRMAEVNADQPTFYFRQFDNFEFVRVVYA